MKNHGRRLVDALSSWSTRPGVLHERLTAAIQDAVRNGTIYPGMRVPAERHLAKLLGISRTTVVTSYNDLRTDGWVESRVGSGTWISKKKPGLVRASAHAAMVARSPLLNMLEASGTEAIDFATTTLHPLRELITPVLDSVHAHAVSLLSERAYMPYGLPLLREAVARYFTLNGAHTDAEDVLITTGGQQAISLICALLLQRGDYVLVENPTYYGVLESLRVSGARLAAVPVGKNHVSPDLLQQRVSAVSPRMVYLTPTGQNPTGVSMSDSVRHELAKGSIEHGVTIVEDEVLADLTLVGARPRPFSSFVRDANVLTVGSLSKLFWPSLRVGWIRGPRALIGRLAKLKTALDLGSALLPQSIAVDLLEIVGAARNARRRELTAKRNLAVDLLREYVPESSFIVPRAGLGLWVQIPAVDCQVLAQVALRYGLVLSHGNLFSVDESHGEFVRIPFALDEELLDRGIRSLGQAVRDVVGAKSSVSPPPLALT